MVTAAAFHQVLDRLMRAESAVALRPRLLVAVRDTVREWSADGPDIRGSAGPAETRRAGAVCAPRSP